MLIRVFIFLFPLGVEAKEAFDLLGNPSEVFESAKVVLGFVAIALIPALFVMMTSFTRLVIIFSFIRQALGLSQLLPQQLTIGLSLLLTFFIMSDVFESIYTKSIVPYMDQKISQKEALEKGFKPLRKFMLNQTRESDLKLFQKLKERDHSGKTALASRSGSLPDLKKETSKDKVKASVLLPAFVMSELKTAFQIGFIVYIPFLIIDLLVAGTLMSIGMVALSPLSISLPLKIILFVFVDGWSLLADSLVRSFQ